MTVAEDSILRFGPGIMLRHDQRRGQWMLLAPERILVLDEAGLEVVRTCVGQSSSIAEGIDRLARQYGASRAEIAQDVLETLTDWINRGFVIS